MNLKKILISAALSPFLMSSISRAAFYSCSFTEPFFNLYISTKEKIISATSINTLEPSEFYRRIPYNSDKKEGENFSINDNITIQHNEQGSDGMSDLKFPYLIKYKIADNHTLYGGCTSEMMGFQTLINRLSSEVDEHGLSKIDYWPGESAYMHGYKVIKNVTIPANTNYTQIEDFRDLDPKKCTLVKGKRFIPIKAAKDEIYTHLSSVTKYKILKDVVIKETLYDKAFKVTGEKVTTLKKGKFVFELSPTQEGQCFMQYGSKIVHDSCPNNDINQSYQVVGIDNKPLKTPAKSELQDGKNEYSSMNLVYTRCKEGHWSWISADKVMIKDNVHFAADSEVSF